MVTLFKIIKDTTGILEELKLTKSDTAKFVVEIVDPISLQPCILKNGDTIEFTVKKNFSDKVPLLRIEGAIVVGTNKASFTIDGTDTSSLKLGKYFCSIKLTIDGEVNTIVTPKCDNLDRYSPNFNLCGSGW